MKDLWKVNAQQNEGIYLRFSKGVNKELRSAILDFVKWVRQTYIFPVKVIAYIKASQFIINGQTKEQVVASIFLPFDQEVSPYIRLATGDYEELIEELDVFSAKCATLASLAHEITHYYQWIKDLPLDETQADRLARKKVYKYIDYCGGEL
ncbi:MAG: hypothetical protein HFE77_01285 [Clostridiales bacterium]|nr:hypothetical protein [Clostridiales bacterium]